MTVLRLVQPCQGANVMDHSAGKRGVIALLMGALLPLGCGPVAQSPEVIAKQSNEAAAGASSSGMINEINRNISAAAMVGAPAAPSDYQIGPEDLLEITLFNVTEADGRMTPRTVAVRVSQEGIISVPLLGEVNTKGLTIAGLEKTLRQRYDKYFYNPQVGVLVKEYRQRVSVIGAVQKPGVIELTGPKTVTEILAFAGGVAPNAGNQVHIYRQTPRGRESHVIDLSVLANNASLINAENVGLITMPVQPGDVINVPAAGTFFVDGAVKRPGPYPLGRSYSLTQALATAGGVDPELNSSDITIFRRKGSANMQSISVDYAAIVAGSAVDPQIEQDDVIVVPMNTVKYLVKRFIGNLVGGVSIGSLVAGS
jgi:polysaccharide export outer membrane protein